MKVAVQVRVVWEVACMCDTFTWKGLHRRKNDIGLRPFQSFSLKFGAYVGAT